MSHTVFPPSPTCPSCECPRRYDFLTAFYTEDVCCNPICSGNMDAEEYTAPATDAPLHPDYWAYRRVTSTSMSTDSSQRRFVVKHAAPVVKSTATPAVTPVATPAVTPAATPVASAKTPRTKKHKRVFSVRKVGAHANKVGKVSKKHAKTAPAAVSVKREPTAVQADVSKVGKAHKKHAKTAPAAVSVKREPTEVQAPLEKIPHDATMYWPVGQFTLRQINGDVGKMSDIVSSNGGATAGAFTKIIKAGVMLPPMHPLPAGLHNPQYYNDDSRASLSNMLLVLQRTGP